MAAIVFAGVYKVLQHPFSTIQFYDCSNSFFWGSDRISV